MGTYVYQSYIFKGLTSLYINRSIQTYIINIFIYLHHTQAIISHFWFHAVCFLLMMMHIEIELRGTVVTEILFDYTQEAAT